jgi:hypothetical protein
MSSVKYKTISLPEKKVVLIEHPLHCISAVSNNIYQQHTREPTGSAYYNSKFGILNLLNTK